MGTFATPFSDFLNEQAAAPATPFSDFLRDSALPTPEEATAVAGLKAQQAADITTVQAGQILGAAGQRMMQGAIPPELQAQEPDALLDKRPLPPNPNVQSIISGVEQMAQPDLLEKAGGAHQILGGAMGIGAGALPMAVAAAPVATAVGLGAGTLAQTGTEAGLKKLGIPENYANLAGDVAGLGAGIAAGHGAGLFTDFLKGRNVAEEMPTVPQDIKQDMSQDIKPEPAPVEAQPEIARPPQYVQSFEDFLKGKESRNVVPFEEQRQPTPQAEPKQAAVAVGEPPAAPQAQMRGVSQPGITTGVVNLPVDRILADPARFQYKADTGGKAGVGEELQGIRKYDPELGGVVSVWQDPQNGETYVVNGHHRLELAQRTGTENIAARYLNADTAEEARTKGALINIAEGRGTSIDAAKLFRDSEFTPEDLASRGVSVKGNIAKEGAALSRLAPSLFDKVVSGELPSQRGAIIGENLSSPQEQHAASDLLDRAEAKGRRLTNGEVKEMIDFVKGAPTEDITQDQTSLFGEDVLSKNLILEKSEVSDFIQKRLSQERRLFTTTGTTGAAERLSQAGNVIKPEENAKIAGETSQAQAVYDKLKTSAGPINDVLDAAARQLASGGRKGANEVKQNAYEQARKAISETLAGRAEIGTGRNGSIFGSTEEVPREPETPGLFDKPAEPQKPQSELAQPAVLNSLLGGFHEPLRKFGQADVLPTLKNAASGVSGAADDVLKVWAPSLRGESGQKASAILRGHLGELARSTDIAKAALKNAHSYFQSQEPAANYDFIDRVERGAPQPTGDQQRIANVLRKLLDERRQQVQDLGTGKLEDYYENYYPHIWQDPEQVQGVIGRMLGRRPLEGTKSFLKQRTLPTFQAGLDAGLKPVSDNPVDLALLKVREMDRYTMAQRVLADYKDQGIAKLVRIGQKPPPGSVKIDDPMGTVYGPPSAGGLTIQGNYYAPQEAAQVLNNYLGPGLSHNGIYRVLMGANNTLNQAQLGLSAFHLGFTSMEASISKGALGMEQLMRGRPVLAAKSLAEAAPGVISPFRTFFKGNKLLNEWYKPGNQGGEIAAIADELAKAGGRAHMDDFYRTNAIKNMTQAWRDGNVIGAALRVPLATLEATAKPIMEYLVPRQKLGVFLDMARFEMDQHNRKVQGLSGEAKLNAVEDLRRNLRQAWDSVDNRMGQMVYDNLFWNRTAKDLAMLTVRSVGWNLGTLREVAGGLGDVVRQPTRALQGKPVNLKRLSYIASLATFPALYGAVYMYLRTGQGPQELKDYYFPKTGEKDAQGFPQRVNLPTYNKDIYHYRTDPLGTLEAKLSPLANLTIQMTSNKDFFGKKIRNTHDPLIKQLEEEAKFIGSQVVPLGIRNYQRQQKAGEGMLTKAQNFIGITPAPRSVSHPRRRHK